MRGAEDDLSGLGHSLDLRMADAPHQSCLYAWRTIFGYHCCWRPGGTTSKQNWAERARSRRTACDSLWKSASLGRATAAIPCSPLECSLPAWLPLEVPPAKECVMRCFPGLLSPVATLLGVHSPSAHQPGTFHCRSRSRLHTLRLATRPEARASGAVDSSH